MAGLLKTGRHFIRTSDGLRLFLPLLLQIMGSCILLFSTRVTAAPTEEHYPQTECGKAG